MSYPFIDLNSMFITSRGVTGNIDYTNANTLFLGQSRVTGNVISQQQQLNDIVTAENQRLIDKKQSVNNAILGQQRAVALNESNRLQQNSYTNLLIILIITLVSFIAIMIASNYLTFIPQVVFDLLSIIVISVGIYFGLSNYLDIQSRSLMDFNKLDLPGLAKNISGNTTAAGSTSSGDLLSGLDSCVGAACCSGTTKWDQGNNVCKENFTTLTFSYDNNITSASAAANSPYEFKDYVPV